MYNWPRKWRGCSKQRRRGPHRSRRRPWRWRRRRRRRACATCWWWRCATPALRVASRWARLPRRPPRSTNRPPAIPPRSRAQRPAAARPAPPANTKQIKKNTFNNFSRIKHRFFVGQRWILFCNCHLLNVKRLFVYEIPISFHFNCWKVNLRTDYTVELICIVATQQCQEKTSLNMREMCFFCTFSENVKIKLDLIMPRAKCLAFRVARISTCFPSRKENFISSAK